MTIIDKTDKKLTIPVGIGVVQTETTRNFYNTSDATATANDILVNKTAYSKYGKLTGTLDLDAEKGNSYTEGYNNGYNVGNEIGYSNGETNGYNNGYNEGVEVGYNDGYSNGESAGYSTGYDEGVVAGYDSGVEIGKGVGRNEIIEGQSDATITPQNVLRGYVGYGKNNERIVGESDAITSIKLVDYGLKLAYGTFSTIPEIIDLSGIKDWNNMFYNCNNITYLNLDLRGATSVYNMLIGACKRDADVTLNVDGVGRLDNIFYSSNFNSVKLLNAKPTSLSYAFGFSYIENVPEMDTSELTSAENVFNYSYGRIKHIPLLDFSKVERTNGIFGGTGGTTNPIDITGFVNLGKGFKGNNSNYHKFDISLLYVPRQSCLNIFNNMYDMNLNGVTDATFVLRAADKALLSDEDIAIATSKGWTVQ